ncbi:MAG: glycosyltransferase family 4 protein [Gaiellaceae bacterium]
MRVLVVTTSYPRTPADFAGRFVADAVERLRARSVEVDVVGPDQFRDFGLAEHGIAAGLRRKPWLAPPLLASLIAATRRASRSADLVHAHWLQVGVAAMASRRPYVVTLHGTDVELARRSPRLARAVLSRARGVVCVSHALAEAARELGARDPHVIPNGVELPSAIGEEATPPHVLFAGRLSPEKGIDELLEATRGLALRVVGDGPMRDRVPSARGFIPPEELAREYAEAAVVCCPSRREGFGLVAAEAMAHGRPVVATRVGGLVDLVIDGETGILVDAQDPLALRRALERLLADAALRARLGAAGREHVSTYCNWDVVTTRLIDVYRRALS